MNFPSKPTSRARVFRRLAMGNAQNKGSRGSSGTSTPDTRASRRSRDSGGGGGRAGGGSRGRSGDRDSASGAGGGWNGDDGSGLSYGCVIHRRGDGMKGVSMVIATMKRGFGWMAGWAMRARNGLTRIADRELED